MTPTANAFTNLFIAPASTSRGVAAFSKTTFPKGAITLRIAKQTDATPDLCFRLVFHSYTVSPELVNPIFKKVSEKTAGGILLVTRGGGGAGWGEGVSMGVTAGNRGVGCNI
jgi:hypothetical protein